MLAAVLTAVAAPAIAQAGFSESFRFLKAVRERDGNTATAILDNPSSTAINARDRGTGDTALHILVRERDANWLAFMLSRGARPDIANSEGTTPLILAAQLGWTEGVEHLLARGASVNLGNSRGETPLILAVQQRHLPVVRLLMRKGADPNQTDNVAGLSALDYARQDRRASNMVELLENPPQRSREAAGPEL